METLVFIVALGLLIYGIFFAGRGNRTFTSSEMDAFKHAEQVKKDLQAVQKMVGPAKPDTSLTLGAFLPKKPEEPPK